VTVGPLPLLVLPMVAGAAAYFLRRWRNLPPLLTAGVAAVLGVLLLALPFGQPLRIGGQEVVLEQPVSLLGRALTLGVSDRLALGFLFLAGAALFLLAWRFGRGDLFAPLGSGVLGLLGGVLLIRPLIYSALLFQIAATLVVFSLHAEEEGPAHGGLRYLTFCTLALPGLLVSHWLLGLYTLSPDQQSLLQVATGLIAFSFALLLGLFPFHAWVPAVGGDGLPLVTAFVYTVMSGGVWFLMLGYLQTYPWLVQSAYWGRVVPALGLVTAVVGGVLGTTRRGPGVWAGYAVMVDTGLALVALAQGTQSGIGVALNLLFVRVMGAALMAAGLSSLQMRSGGVPALPDGVGWQAPWSTLAVVIGGLSLAGFPPTAGFAGRWALLSGLLSTDPATGCLLLLVSVGPLVGLVQIVGGLLRRHRPIPRVGEREDTEKTEEPAPEPILNVALLLLFIAATVLLGLFPQALATAAYRLAGFFAW